MTPPPSLQDLIATVRRDTGTDDTLEQLATAAAAASELADTTDALLGHYVDRARRDGHSWTEISQVLGVSKQAVHKRFAPSRAARPWFGRYTARARRTVEAAEQAAVHHGYNYVGTEHLLLGFYAEPGGVAAQVLLAHGVTAEAAEAAVVSRTRPGSRPREGRPPLTPRASEALAGAVAEAVDLGHGYVGTEHLLLSLYRDQEALAYQVLTELGLDADTARADVVRQLADYQPARPAGPAEDPR